MNRTTISRLMLALLLANPLMIMAMDPGSANPGLPARLATPGAQQDAQPADQQGAQPVVQPAAQQEAVEPCTICLDDEIPVADMRQLACTHRFCVGCLGDKLDRALNGGDLLGARMHLRCGRRGCHYEMNEVDIRAITGQEARVEAFSDVMLRLQTGAAGSNAALINCPTRDCPGLYPVDPGEAQWPVRCAACNQQYCSRCQRQHEPGENLQMLDWCFCPQCNRQHEEGQPCPAAAPVQNNNGPLDADALRIQEEQRQNLEWIRQNTRPCPRCHVNIEKNGGCNHMTCRTANCGYHFCFECLGPWQIDANHPTYYNCLNPRVAPEAVEALRAVPEPGQRPAPGFGNDQMTAEEIAAEVYRIEQANQNNLPHNRLNPHGDPNNGGPNDPNPRRGGNNGPRFRAQPRSSNAPVIIGVGLIVAAVGATAYGCYKLYQYLSQPKPDAKKDVKAALADLHKEAIRGKNIAISGVYTKGLIKAFFGMQVKAGSFAALTHENMALLTARVDALENACSNQAAIEEEYAAFMRCVSDLIVQANQSPYAKASEDRSEDRPAVVTFDATKQPQVKKTSVPAKAATEKVLQRTNRRGRLVKKVR